MASRPANEVGGDLADYLSLDGTRLGLSLGDVAGRGLGAATLMAKLQATLRAIAPDSGSLAEMAERINRIFCRDCGRSCFATLISGELPLKPPFGTKLFAHELLLAKGTESTSELSQMI